MTVDSPTLLSMTQEEEAGYGFYSPESKSSSPRFVESPSSSPSSSCRSSICSVSSDKEAKKSRSPSSRLTSFFQSSAHHYQAGSQQQGRPAEKKEHGGKNIVRKIMHPHQYKRELEVHQQQSKYRFEQYVAVPESIHFTATSDGEYQPAAHRRKSFIRRLGLKRSSL